MRLQPYLCSKKFVIMKADLVEMEELLNDGTREQMVEYLMSHRPESREETVLYHKLVNTEYRMREDTPPEADVSEMEALLKDGSYQQIWDYLNTHDIDSRPEARLRRQLMIKYNVGKMKDLLQNGSRQEILDFLKRRDYRTRDEIELRIKLADRELELRGE